MTEKLTIDHLQTEEAKKLFRHLYAEIERLEKRIAYQGKVFSRSYMKTHEEMVFEQRIAG